MGKAFDITYVRLFFHSPRPESFAIFKRTTENKEWTPYQYYSATCRDTYGIPDSTYVRREDETRALCTSEFSDISPLTGGNEWVTATDIRIILDRLNTFRDEVFGDPRVLKSYFYAITEFAVGGSPHTTTDQTADSHDPSCQMNKVIVCANSTNNCAAAARDYGISEKPVRDCKKNEDTISKMAKKKCASRHGKAQWPEIEHLNKWIREHRQNGITITRNNICVEKSGWMDEDGVKFGIENVWNKRTGGLCKENSLFVWDRFSPGGLTSILQPLDVSINKPFKENSGTSGWYKTYTKGGNMRTPPLHALCEFVAKSWDAIRVKVITKSFKKCGISNPIDGEEDDMLWRSLDKQDSNTEDKDETSDSESDPYGDLHLSATHEYDFDFEGVSVTGMHQSACHQQGWMGWSSWCVAVNTTLLAITVMSVFLSTMMLPGPEPPPSMPTSADGVDTPTSNLTIYPITQTLGEAFIHDEAGPYM
ncbi:Laminin subunit gamma-1-like 2, partial [Homarus americanus]